MNAPASPENTPEMPPDRTPSRSEGSITRSGQNTPFLPQTAQALSKFREHLGIDKEPREITERELRKLMETAPPTPPPQYPPRNPAELEHYDEDHPYVQPDWCAWVYGSGKRPEPRRSTRAPRHISGLPMNEKVVAMLQKIRKEIRQEHGSNGEKLIERLRREHGGPPLSREEIAEKCKNGFEILDD